MSAVTTTPSLQVLKNRGVPVLVHKVEPDPNGVRYHRVFTTEDESGEPVLETLFIKFDALAMAEIEERWADPTPYVTHMVDGREVSRPATGDEQGTPRDAMEVWESALESSPYKTLIQTCAIVWECTTQEAGKRLIDDKVDEYSTAIGAAVLMANGVEGDAVVRLLKTGVSSSKRLRAEVAAAASKAVEEMEAEEAKAISAESDDVAPATPTSPSQPQDQSSSDSWSSGANSGDPLVSSGA